MIALLRRLFPADRPSPSYPVLPAVSDAGESSIKGLFLLGDVAGRPLIKVGLNDGFDLAERLADDLGQAPKGDADYHVIVVGAGVAGMATAMRLHRRGLSCCAIDAGRAFQTLRNFTKGKVLLAEPASVPLKDDLPFTEGITEGILASFDAAVAASGVEVREHTQVTDIRREAVGFRVTTERGSHTARRVVLAIGKSGNPRKAGAPGELDHPHKIAHYLKDPADYQGKHVCIYGGGDVAAEAALALCDANTVTLVTIDPEFVFPKKRNVDAMRAKQAQGRLQILMNSRLAAIGPDHVAIEDQGTKEKRRLVNDQVFEMIGAELPIPFFRKIGIAMTGAWDRARWLTLGISAILVSAIYLWAKGGKIGLDGAEGLGIHDLPMPFNKTSFWYSGMYAVVMLGFGFVAMRRWSKGWTDRYQMWRFTSLIVFQIVSFVGVEILLTVYAGDAWWRAYAVNNPFPLLFDSFYGYTGLTAWSTGWILVALGAIMTFLVIPIAVRWHGKRFCTWVCGCGGLAETLGDRWRHLAPKGERSRRLEVMNSLVLFWALVSAAVIIIGYDGNAGAAGPWHSWYSVFVDFWLVAVIPVILYPIWGGKVWCRYWCPLAKYMQVLSKWYGRLGIAANDKCIQCTQCSKYCQVGVDVMQFAKNQQRFDNTNSSCIHCGICITVCPMDVLTFDLKPGGDTHVRVVDQSRA